VHSTRAENVDFYADNVISEEIVILFIAFSSYDASVRF
jgi:hypothetical protein